MKNNVMFWIVAIFSLIVYLPAIFTDFNTAFAIIPAISLPLILLIITLFGFKRKNDTVNEALNIANSKVKIVKNVFLAVIIILYLISVSIIVLYDIDEIRIKHDLKENAIESEIEPLEIMLSSNYRYVLKYSAVERTAIQITILASLILYIIFILYINKSKKITDDDRKILLDYYNGYVIRIVVSLIWYTAISIMTTGIVTPVS